MRKYFPLAALALGLPSYAALASEQVTSDSIAPPQVPVADVSDASTSDSGPIYLVSGSDRIAALHIIDNPLDPRAQLCLAEGENAVLASDRVVFALFGEECFVPAIAEVQGFAIEDAAARVDIANSEDMAGRSAGAPSNRGEAIVVAAKGPSSARYAAGARLPAASVCLEENDTLTVLERSGTRVLRGPDCFDLSVQSTATNFVDRSLSAIRRPRARTGAVRGAEGRTESSTARGNIPIIYRVTRASDAVIKRYPRGTIVARNTKLCLSEGEQITIVGSSGQRVTYQGPSCMQRNARPTRENVGGFTFG